MGQEIGRSWWGKSAVILACAAISVAMTACAARAPKTSKPAADSKAVGIADPTPTPSVDSTPTLAPTPVPKPVIIVDKFHPELLPKDLENRIGIRDYHFTRNEDTGQATVSTSVINLSGKEPISFDMAARFTDGDDGQVAQTDWTRVNLKPLAKQQFFAETIDRRAVAGAPLIRLVTEKKTE